MSTRSPACSWARSNKPCQAVNASIGTDAASTWVSRAGLRAIAEGGAQQNSAVAPWAYQSFMPNTSSPTAASAPAPTAAMVPENSCPGMAWRRFSPDLVCVVGCHNNSVWVTPTARTCIKTSPRWGCGASTSAGTSPGTGRESSHCQTFILNLVVKVDSCSGRQGHVELGLRDDPPSTGQLLHHRSGCRRRTCEQTEQSFSGGRVGPDRVAQDRVRDAAEHGRLGDRHELARLRAQRGEA